MSKTESDDVKKIETSFLRKHKYFTGWRNGQITWTSGFSENKTSVGIEVFTSIIPDGQNYCRIHYTQTNNYTNEEKKFDYKIPLVTTACNYGGKRYWFICPWYKNGTYCGRRVGVLYKDGDYFACRHCYDITYASRNLSGRAKQFGSSLSFPEVDKLREEVKRTHYKGKLTRKYLRYLKAEEQAESSFIGMANLLTSKFDKVNGKITGKLKVQKKVNK
jgi:hypothetical protein